MSLRVSRKVSLAGFAMLAFSGAALMSGKASALTLTADTALEEDVTDGIVVEAGNTVTLDLNGHSVTNTATGMAAIINRGALTVTGEGSVSTDQNNTAAVTNYPDATLTLSGGSYASGKWYIVRNYGAMTINDGVTVTANEQTVSNASMVTNGWYGGVDQNNGAGITANSGSAEPTLTINGGTFTAGLSNCSVIKNDDYSNLVINGGSFSQPRGSLADCDAVILNWNVAEIKGGTFFSENGPVIANGAYADPADKGLITISGGTFTTGANGTVLGYGSNGNGTGALTVTGGTFSTALYPMPVNPNAANDGKYYDISIKGGSYGTNFSDAGMALIANGYSLYQVADEYVVVPAAEAPIPGNIYIERGEAYDLGAILNDTAKTYGNFDFSGLQAVAAVSNWKITGVEVGEGTFTYGFDGALNHGGMGGKSRVVVYAEASDDADADAAQNEAKDIVADIVTNGEPENFNYAEGVTAQDVKDAVADGATMATTVSTYDVDEESVSGDDKAKIADEMEESLTEEAVLLGYYEIDISLLAIKDGAATILGNITELTNPLTITLALPEDLDEVADGYVRAYYLVRVHNGETTLIKATDNGDGTISFNSDKFSTYALVYEDTVPTLTPDTGAFTGSASMHGDYRGLVATVVAMIVMTIVMEVVMYRKNHAKNVK